MATFAYRIIYKSFNIDCFKLLEPLNLTFLIINIFLNILRYLFPNFIEHFLQFFIFYIIILNFFLLFNFDNFDFLAIFVVFGLNLAYSAINPWQF